MSSFTKISLGIVFLFNFQIGRFNLLPDIIGYLFMSVALFELSKQSVKFHYAKIPAIILVFFSLTSIGKRLNLFYYHLPTWIVELIMEFLIVILFFLVIKGLIELAHLFKNRHLVLSLTKKIKIVIGIRLLLILMLVLLIFSNGWLIMIAQLIYILGEVASLFFMLFLLRETDHYLH